MMHLIYFGLVVFLSSSQLCFIGKCYDIVGEISISNEPASKLTKFHSFTFVYSITTCTKLAYCGAVNNWSIRLQEDL